MAKLCAAEVALAPLTVGRPEASEMVAAAEAGGFRRLGMSLWAPDGRLDATCTDRRRLRSVGRALAHTGLEVTDVSVVVLNGRLGLDKVRRVMEVGRELGARRVVVMNRDRDVARAAEGLASLADLGGELDMLVGLEFMPYSATPDLAAAVALVRSVASPRVGLVLDVLHLFRSGAGAREASNVPVPLVLVQLCDAAGSPPPRARLREESLTNRRYPGHGDLPLRTVVAGLPAGVPMTLEAPVARDARLPPAERSRRAAAALRWFAARSSSSGEGHRPLDSSGILVSPMPHVLSRAAPAIPRGRNDRAEGRLR
jgi:sugar phosphate isomerase/epimerase